MKSALIAATILAVLAGCARELALVKGEMPVVAGSLAGGPWEVEDINGSGVPDNARIDIRFDPGVSGEASVAGGAGTGRVSGKSGCNRFGGAWKQAGAAITLGPLMGTKMACAPALMDIEAKFLAALGAASSVTFDATGAAMLKAADGRVIKIRREPN